MELTQNYRSCQSIVDISGLVITRNSNIVGCVSQKVTDPLIAILYEKDKELEMVKEFTKLITENNLNMINSRIIVRNNSLKNQLLGLKNQHTNSNSLEDLARAIYLSTLNDNISELKVSFELFAKSIQRIYFKNDECLNRQYLYKPSEMEMHTWKKLLWEIKNILTSSDSLLDFSMTWKKWKNELQKIMHQSINTLSVLKEKTCELGNIRSGNSNKTLEEVLFCNKTKNTIEYKIETIHGCKGMSLDAVLFISSYTASRDKDSGGHWKDWFDVEEISEKNRLAYVAFSRAKHMLALGIPRTTKFNDKDKNKLLQYGFKIIEL